jgi:hypothetical protein
MDKSLIFERLAEAMQTQFQVWAGTENAVPILEDCCHTPANVLRLDPGEERERFLAWCKGETPEHEELQRLKAENKKLRSRVRKLKDDIRAARDHATVRPAAGRAVQPPHA